MDTNKPDFSGYATKNDIKCSDGRVIRHGAFREQHGAKVPLVWQHLHDEPGNVLGHAKLEARPDGVYAYAFFNNSDSANRAKEAVKHGDIDSLSIFANKLVQNGMDVVHGVIREVSLVLAGANPGAVIDNVSLAHADGEVYEDETEAIISMGDQIRHADGDSESDSEKKESESDGEKTVREVVDTMNEEQQKALLFLVNEALQAGDPEDDEDPKDKDEEGDKMGHNAFEGTSEEKKGNQLSHAEFSAIIERAKQNKSSLQEELLAHSKEYGISNIEMLFPEAKDINTTPEFIKPQSEWVPGVISGTRKSPFSRIRTRQADVTADEARARGYVTGKKKKDEVFKLLQRVTTPKTVYKKQKLDRDDILDITDFNVVNWIRAEMRMMLDWEIGRAVLMGDGRAASDDDKIDEEHIRPICGDDELYVHYVDAAPFDLRGDAGKFEELVDALTASMVEYKGSGTPTLYIGAAELTGMLLLKDKMSRRIYNTKAELADAIGVKEIVRTDIFGKRGVTSASSPYQWFAAIVNLSDYTIGTDAGGQLTSFEDFDIDYNQHKYLIETRLSGALTRIKSAIVLYQKGTETKEPGKE